jgi:hypothetical protein
MLLAIPTCAARSQRTYRERFASQSVTKNRIRDTTEYIGGKRKTAPPADGIKTEYYYKEAK